METSSPPPPAIELSTHLYYQLVYTLTDLLPPPLDDTPEGLRARNHAAIAKVAALLPVNANEIDLAAQCIAARAQAEDVLRLLRQHPNDINLVIRLNAQYASMVRTSLSVLGRLMRVQALRQKREAKDGAANQDAWAQHIAEQSMLLVADPDPGPRQAASPKAAPIAAQEPPAARVDQRVAENISENATNSQDAAFETWLSEQPWNRASTGPGETGLSEILRAAMAQSHLASRQLPADARESPRQGPRMSAECPDRPPSRGERDHALVPTINEARHVVNVIARSVATKQSRRNAQITSPAYCNDT